MIKKRILTIFSTLFLSLGLIGTYNVKAETPQIKRLWGNNRYETCVKIVQEGWKSKSDYAVIVNGENYPDALSAAPLAKKYNAPILLTEDCRLDENTYKELKRLGVKNVFIVGGQAVISPSVEERIKKMGISTQRFFGVNRNATSASVASQIGTNNGIILASDSDFTDALSAAPIAAKLQMPIILMPKGGIPDSVKNFLVAKDISATYIIGGKDIISDDIALQFPNVKRIEGEDKYERNANVISTFQDKIDFSNILLAYSEKFADALSGSAFAAINGNPIVLMGDVENVHTKYILNSNINNINSVNVLGGTAGIKEAQVGAIFIKNKNDSQSSITKDNSIENNGSSVVKEGDWIYYSGNRQNSITADSIQVSELYRIKNDSSRIEKLSNDFANRIWIKGEWVYYINYQGANKVNSLYRIKKDGKDAERITEDTPTYVNFDGDYIYYAKYIDRDNSNNFSMYRIKRDGTGKQNIGYDHGINIQKVGDWIYYANVDDNFKIYKIKTDGTSKNLVSNDSAVNYMKAVGNWIYYCNVNDNNSLYRINIDSLERQKLNYHNSRNINISGDEIYYSSIDEKDIGILYKMKINGADSKVLSKVDCSTSVQVQGEYIYCVGYKSKGIYRIKKDGNYYENLNINESIISLNVAGDWIYYNRFNPSDMTNTLYKMKIDGSLDQRVD